MANAILGRYAIDLGTSLAPPPSYMSAITTQLGRGARQAYRL